ncbi:cysteine desulfurase [Granulicatella balaenopterae]|uniref:cysteine desulfurase n=1 Tax=Granulicatella balaenopterae TaxID=137733 RepID=A0A1H9K190_9LACT|nr:cysteine desulfurase family protein [Granulicatella balaenopterae]SEQ92986.1 cysteine desulfurase [Granulicatella balaenopterae]
MNYLDHAATTPIHPEVQKAIFEAMNHFGNPSSLYKIGRLEKKVLADCKQVIKDELHAENSDSIIFTASGSEANNLAIKSIIAEFFEEKGHLITSNIEHPSVRKVFEWAETQGFDVTYLPVNEEGLLSADEVAAALRPDTRLVSIMTVNNEVGSMQPIKEVGEVLVKHTARFHTDAVQAFGQEALDVSELQVDYLSASGHKINAPKGIGFLYKKSSAPLLPLIAGGGQEEGLRAGTENMPYIVGLTEAIKQMAARRPEQTTLNKELLAYLQEQLTANGISFEMNGYSESNSSHVCNLWLKGLKASQLIILSDLKDVMISAGSACSAGSLKPSPVLTALFGEESERLQESVRISFGLGSKREDIDEFIAIVKNLAKRQK